MVAPLVLAAAGSSLLGGLGGILGGGAKKKQAKKTIADYTAAETGAGVARDASLGYFQPYSEGGASAFGRANAMMEPGFQYQPTDPSYAFRFNEGQRAIDRSAAAGGSLYSGGTLKALARYGQDFASTEFGKDFDRNNQLARFGLNAAQGMSNVQSGYVNALFNAADGRAGARTQRGNAIAGQWDAGIGGVQGALGSYFGF